MAVTRMFRLGDNIICTFEQIGTENEHYIYSIDITGSGYMFEDMASDVYEIGGSGTFATYQLLVGLVRQDNVVIPVGIRGIGDGAFENIGSNIWAGTLISISGVKNVYIGEDVEYIGKHAFRKTATGNTGIKHVFLLGDNPKLRWLKEGAFWYQYNLIDCNFRGLVDTLGNNVFQGCYKLESINLSDNYYYDEDYFNDQGDKGVFYLCYKLKNISENNVVVHINGRGNYNYYYCNNLDYITINNPIDANPPIGELYANGLSLSVGKWGEDINGNIVPGLDVEYDEVGNIKTSINTVFEEYIDTRYIDWALDKNRSVTLVSNFSIYVYHMGRIIQLRCGSSGDIPVLCEGQWKWLKCAQDSENPAYSPVHFVHNGQWYQLKY